MKKLLKKYFPHHSQIKNHKDLRFLSGLLHRHGLWSYNKYTVSKAFSVGLFSALIPLPFQMVIAALLAIGCNANLPISVALAWVSNPITTPAIAYICYKVGAFLMGKKLHAFHFEYSYEWLLKGIDTIVIPFLVGSVVVSISLSIISYFLVRLIWRIAVTINWYKRKQRLNKESS